jgi:hypothetical protein
MIRQRHTAVSVGGRASSQRRETLRNEVLHRQASTGELLCSCTGPMQQAGQQADSIDAYDNARCMGYGLKPLDPEYAQCRHALAQMRYPGDPQADLAALTIENLARRSADRRRPEP